MEDIYLVSAVAARVIDRHGSKSLDSIAQHCEMATAIGDQPSLRTWLDIAAAVQELQSLAAGAQGTTNASNVVFSAGRGASL